MKQNWWEYVIAGLILVLCLVVGLGIAEIYAPEPVIGVIRFEDALTIESSGELVEMIEAARQDHRVAGVALEILSPGGLATSSENVFYALLNLREVKPVVVAIDTLAVSGGYYMAVAGNRIYAPSSSYIGNVGTRGPRPSDPAISPDELSSGPFKLTGGNRFDRIQQLDVVKDAFVGNVVYQRANAEMNPLKIDAEAVAEARIYLGSEAVAVGLIDREGSLSDAIAATAELAGVESYQAVDLAGYFGYGAETPVPPIQESIRSMVENASAEAIFLLDSRIPLPGVLESTELDQHLLRLRSVDAGTLNPTQSQSPGSLQSPFR